MEYVLGIEKTPAKALKHLDDDFELKVQFEAGNEILSILGASGCGKSMT